MTCLSGFQSCDLYGLASPREHFQKRSAKIGNKQDNSIPTPGASPAIGRSVGQHLRRATHEADAFQFAVRKESYRRAVGGPKWIPSSIRSRQRLRGKPVQGPEPELAFASVSC